MQRGDKTDYLFGYNVKNKRKIILTTRTTAMLPLLLLPSPQRNGLPSPNCLRTLSLSRIRGLAFARALRLSLSLYLLFHGYCGEARAIRSHSANKSSRSTCSRAHIISHGLIKSCYTNRTIQIKRKSAHPHAIHFFPFVDSYFIRSNNHTTATSPNCISIGWLFRSRRKPGCWTRSNRQSECLIADCLFEFSIFVTDFSDGGPCEFRTPWMNRYAKNSLDKFYASTWMHVFTLLAIPLPLSDHSVFQFQYSHRHNHRENAHRAQLLTLSHRHIHSHREYAHKHQYTHMRMVTSNLKNARHQRRCSSRSRRNKIRTTDCALAQWNCNSVLKITMCPKAHMVERRLWI